MTVYAKILANYRKRLVGGHFSDVIAHNFLWKNL